MDLDEAAITDKAIEHLKEAAWPNLKVLDLCTIMPYLSQEPPHSARTLDFIPLRLQKDEGLEPTYANLNQGDNKISLKGANSLTGSGWLHL